MNFIAVYSGTLLLGGTNLKILDNDILMINKAGDIEKIFKTYSEATNELGLKGSSLISRICKAKRGSCLGYYWLHGSDYKKFKNKSTYYDWLDSNVRITKNIDRDTMPIVKLDKLTYDLIDRYSSLNEAAERNGLNDKNGFDAMIKCCKFSRRTAKGFIWLLGEDYDNLSIEEIKERHNEINNSNPNSKKINKYTMAVLKLDPNSYEVIEEYNNIVDAATQNNMNSKSGIDSIVRCCRFAKKIANGYTWILSSDYKRLSIDEVKDYYENKSNTFTVDRKTLNSTPVVQLKPDTYEFIKVFPSIENAAESVGANKSGISKCCKFQRRKSGGYTWMYLSDFNKYTIDEIKFFFNQIFWN